MTGSSTITMTPALNKFVVDAVGNTVSMASSLTMNSDLTVTSGTLATGNNGFTVSGALSVGGTLDLSGSSLATAFPPFFQVTGVGTVSTGGTVITGDNSMWFKSNLTLDGGTFNFSGATVNGTTIDIDGLLSGTLAGAATSTWLNNAPGAGSIRPVSVDLTNIAYTAGQTRFTMHGTGTFKSSGRSIASIRSGSTTRGVGAVTVQDDQNITGQCQFEWRYFHRLCHLQHRYDRNNGYNRQCAGERW